MKVSRRLRRWAVVAVVLIVLFAATAGALYKWHVHNWAEKRRCVAHIKHLSYGIWVYHGDNGELPDHLGRLFPEYLNWPEMISICPSAGRAIPLHFPDGVKKWSPEGRRILDGFGPEHTDYAYVAGLTPKVETQAWAPPMKDWLLVFEKEANHDGERNVAPLDNRAFSLTEAEFKQQLERTFHEARAAGFDAKVWGYAPGEAPRWLDDLNRIPVAPDE